MGLLKHVDGARGNFTATLPEGMARQLSHVSGCSQSGLARQAPLSVWLLHTGILGWVAFLLQERSSEPVHPHCRWTLCRPEPEKAPEYWVGSLSLLQGALANLKELDQVSCIAGRLFTES